MSRVADIMTPVVASCHPQTPIRRVAQRMREHDVSALPVLESDGRLVGIISQADLVTLRTYREEWDEMVAEHAMVRTVLTTTPDTELRAACDLMLNHNVHRLIVVEPGEGTAQRAIGVLSMTDVVAEMAGDVPHGVPDEVADRAL